MATENLFFESDELIPPEILEKYRLAHNDIIGGIIELEPIPEKPDETPQEEQLPYNYGPT